MKAFVRLPGAIEECAIAKLRHWTDDGKSGCNSASAIRGRFWDIR